MELEEIVLWADVVQAFAVVATLLFVGFQVRYSTRIARMTAAQTSAQLLSQNLGRVTESAELAELLSGSRGNVADLTQGERLRVSISYRLDFVIWKFSMRTAATIFTKKNYGKAPLADCG